MDFSRKPRIGVLLIGAKRFKPLGEGTARGSYEQRKAAEADSYISVFSGFADIVFDGPVYEREEAEARARDAAATNLSEVPGSPAAPAAPAEVQPVAQAVSVSAPAADASADADMAKNDPGFVPQAPVAPQAPAANPTDVEDRPGKDN